MLIFLTLIGLALGGAAGYALARRVRTSRPAIVGALGAFDACLIDFDGEAAHAVGGVEALRALAGELGQQPADVTSVLASLAARNATFAASLDALRDSGAAFDLDLPDDWRAEGRTSGAIAHLRLSKLVAKLANPATEVVTRFADARSEPSWIIEASGALVWANRAWLTTVGAADLDSARERGLSLDGEADRIGREAAMTGRPLEIVRWSRAGGEARAWRFRARAIEGAAAGVWADDVTSAESLAKQLGGQEAAQDATLELMADSVAIFGPDRRLRFHNASFARLWDLEPAWLADAPSHEQLLDHLRRLGRLPEQTDYASFRAAELARHETRSDAETIWRLPDERTLKVASRPHPRGGLVMVFSDVTPELRLRSQFNHLLQVQQATLDKLSDAVAVFGADARLRLHNEAFERFWSVTGSAIAAGLDFDALVDLARRRVHDLQFWRDLKARITDPDPAARTPMLIQILTADRRVVSHQSRPLPDGATLISFTDITDARDLERALAEREAALSDAEKLKREFVGSVSYELRTPLTTILGYAELLEHQDRALDPRARAHLASIRIAAAQLARSIDNVLTMAQFDAGDMAAEMGDVDVARLMHSAAQRWGEAGRAAGVAIEVGAGESVGLIRGDANRLAEVLDHLLENAITHTPAGGKVTIGAERAQGELRLQVCDTGRGIPFHVQAHIFDRFSGHDRAASGLGLALVKAMVELHGGWVALESEPGAGATFTCHLPEAPEAPEARPELF
ncbi:MAG TPA: PAS-domain containing protein [Caulobacteraceae bacterium]|nr:PAS-domain containing protein [Caulobacteraceae bacterium]